MLKAVAFDLGGTLFSKSDSMEKATRAQWKAMKDLGYDIGWERFKEISKEAEKEFKDRYAGTAKKHELGRFPELFFKKAGIEASDEDKKEIGRVFWRTFSEQQELKDGAKEVLDYCREKGLTLAVVTNGNELMTDIRLQKEDMRKEFDAVIYSVDVGAQKSQLRPFDVLLETTGLKGEDCLMVGNRLDEDMYAKKVGMETVLLEEDAKKLREDYFEPDYRIEKLKELKDIITEQIES